MTYDDMLALATMMGKTIKKIETQEDDLILGFTDGSKIRFKVIGGVEADA